MSFIRLQRLSGIASVRTIPWKRVSRQEFGQYARYSSYPAPAEGEKQVVRAKVTLTTIKNLYKKKIPITVCFHGYSD